MHLAYAVIMGGRWEELINFRRPNGWSSKNVKRNVSKRIPFVITHKIIKFEKAKLRELIVFNS
jgi:hypothetical protein